MPTYDFKCPKCGLIFEQQRIPSALKVVHCPTCHELADKVPSAPNFTIHGYCEKNGYSR